MSCSSPFAYSETLDYSPVNYTVAFSGSTSIPGYSIPGQQLCLVQEVCVEQTCGPGCLCGTFKWCKCCSQICLKLAPEYYDCTSTPSIPIWPALNISASISIPMIFDIAVGYTITPVAPPQPIEIASIEIQDFTFLLDVNNDSFSIPVPISLTLSEQNGNISVSVPITSITKNYDGYQINFSFNLLSCLTPSGGVGWLNIQVVGNFTGDGYNQNFTFVCPIVSADAG